MLKSICKVKWQIFLRVPNNDFLYNYIIIFIYKILTRILFYKIFLIIIILNECSSLLFKKNVYLV